MGVFFAGPVCGVGHDLPRHPEMNEQCSGNRVAIRNRSAGSNGRKPQQHELSIAFNGLDLPTRQMLLQRDRVIDKIRFPQPHREYTASNDRAPQTACYCFDFG